MCRAQTKAAALRGPELAGGLSTSILSLSGKVFASRGHRGAAENRQACGGDGARNCRMRLARHIACDQEGRERNPQDGARAFCGFEAACGGRGTGKANRSARCALRDRPSRHEPFPAVFAQLSLPSCLCPAVFAQVSLPGCWWLIAHPQSSIASIPHLRGRFCNCAARLALRAWSARSSHLPQSFTSQRRAEVDAVVGDGRGRGHRAGG